MTVFTCFIKFVDQQENDLLNITINIQYVTQV